MTDAFQSAKEEILAKLGRPDRSKKGSVDEEAWDFINTINALNDYYTTSSCAGRITVFKEPKSGKKHEAEWLYTTHGTAELDAVKESLVDLPKETIWLRMESPIFHVACNGLKAADALLKVCQANGWKRSGIISTGGKTQRQQRVMVEIIGNERIDSPIAIDGALLFDHKYLTFLVEKANKRLSITRAKLETLREIIEKELK